LNDVFDLVLEPTPENNKPAAVINQTQSYKLEFTNQSLLTLPAFTLQARLQPTGPTSADQIDIANVSDGGAKAGLQIAWTIPSLAPNTSGVRTFDATITGITTGGAFGFALTGELQIFPGESDTTNNRRTWGTNATVVTNLAVEDVASTTPEVNVGQTAKIDITYANRGSLDKDRADLRALIAVSPKIYRIENVSDGGRVNADATTITWTIQPLPATGAAARGTRSFELIFDNVTQAGDYNVKIVGEIDRFDASDDPRDNRDSTNIHLDALPRLTLSDIGLSGTLAGDELLIYSFNYGNFGNFSARDAKLKLALPTATSFIAWLDANGQPLPHDNLQANLGDLSPGFQASTTVRIKILKREELLRSFSPGAAIDLKIEATLAAGNVPQPVSKSRIDRLNVPQVVESFYLTHNTFRPGVHGGVELYFDVTQDAEVRFKIYNVAGELVRSFASAPGVIGSRVRQLWDGRNDSGDLVASGLYFVFAEVGYKNERPYRKLIVVR
jgi:hypothetical protein